MQAVDSGSAKQWATRLIDEFGSLANVLATRPELLAGVLGGQIEAAFHLKTFRNVTLHSLRCQMHAGAVFNVWDDVIDYLTAKMSHSEIEVARGLFLDRAQRLISDEILASGSVGEVSLSAQEVARRAILLNASGLILAHNHPSGKAEFSPADNQRTLYIDRACSAIGVRLHDHLLICRTDYRSYRDDNPLWARR